MDTVIMYLVALFVMLLAYIVVIILISGRSNKILVKINQDQTTTMQFLLKHYQGQGLPNIAAPSGSAGGVGTVKPESEILTAVGILLNDELEAHSVVTAIKPGSKEFVRIVDLDTSNRIVDTLKTGVMPARSVQDPPAAPVPGPVGADPQAAAPGPASEKKRKSNPKAIEALKAFNEKRRKFKDDTKTPAPALINTQAVLSPADQAVN